MANAEHAGGSSAEDTVDRGHVRHVSSTEHPERGAHPPTLRSAQDAFNVEAAGRTTRATGRSDASSQSGRGTGDVCDRGEAAFAEALKIGDPSGKSVLEGRFDFDAFFRDLERAAEQNRAQTGAGERCSVWLGLDDTAVANVIDQECNDLDTLAQAAGGLADFLRNWLGMLTARVRGADKLYHCLANCEAAQRGPVGNAVADAISNWREQSDLYRNVHDKGLSPEATVVDCRGDMVANRAGQRAGNAGLRCESVCLDVAAEAYLRRRH